jgi:hypothetical protein
MDGRSRTVKSKITEAVTKSIAEAGLIAQIPMVFELVEVKNGFATIKYGDDTTYMCPGDKLTFTIPYVTKVSNHEHIRRHSEWTGVVNGKYEHCPECGEKNE